MQPLSKATAQYGERQVTDATLALLPGLPRLSSLHLCGVATTDAGLLAALHGLPPLQELVVSWASMPAAALHALASHHGATLRTLRLLECMGCTPGALAAAAAQLTALTQLHAHNLAGDGAGCATAPAGVLALLPGVREP